MFDVNMNYQATPRPKQSHVFDQWNVCNIVLNILYTFMCIFIYTIVIHTQIYTQIYMYLKTGANFLAKSEHSGIKHFPLRFRLEVCCDVATNHWKRFGRPNHPLPVDLQDGGSYWAWLTLLHPFFKNGMLTEKWSKRHFDSINNLNILQLSPAFVSQNDFCSLFLCSSSRLLKLGETNPQCWSFGQMRMGNLGWVDLDPISWEVLVLEVRAICWIFTCKSSKNSTDRKPNKV